MNKMLSFLDIRNVREKKNSLPQFFASVHSVPFLLIFFNYSFLTNLYKYASSFTFLNRASKLCSNFELFHQQIEKNYEQFYKEWFPS